MSSAIRASISTERSADYKFKLYDQSTRSQRLQIAHELRETARLIEQNVQRQDRDERGAIGVPVEVQP